MNPSKPALLLFIFSILISPKAFSQASDPLSAIVPPETDRVTRRVAGDTFEHSNSWGDILVEFKESDQRIFGFSFFNKGANRIIPVEETDFGKGPDREFRFYFRDRARQDLFFSITDTPNAALSQRMESYFYLFPRKNLPAIEPISSLNGANGAELMRVTLPTGETVTFDSKSKEIRDGVFKETGPIDLNPDRFSRKFAQVQYSGNGVQVRVNRRGGDPRLGTVAVINQGLKTCKVPSSALFDQDPESDVNFLFPTDEAFNAFLLKTCKMSFL
jgi:hypothetical protein